MHVCLNLGDGATRLHTILVCGVVGDRESNLALWDDVLHHLSGLGNAPHIVGAGFIFPPERLRDVPRAMLAHVLTRRLVDLHVEYVGFEERANAATRWGSRSLAHTSSACWRISASRPRCCKCTASLARGFRDTGRCASTWRWRRPAKRCCELYGTHCTSRIALPEREPDLQYAYGKAPLWRYKGTWVSLLAARQPDALWKF